MTELLRTLFATTAGTHLQLDGDTIRIIHPERPGRHLLPLVRLDHVVAWNGVTITDDLLHRCAADSRSVTWVTRNGRFLARTSGPITGNPHLRLAQYRAHDDPSHRLHLARTFVAGKLHNYRQLLLRAARDSTGAHQTRLRAIAEHHAAALTRLAETRSLDEVLGIEGNAARRYFQNLALLAPGAFPGRSRQPPTDPINCLLSFGYGMLRVAVHGALEQVGLDPYLGYLHGIRPAKPALALDLMEEHRHCLSTASSSPCTTEANSTAATPRNYQEAQSNSPTKAAPSSSNNGRRPELGRGTTPRSTARSPPHCSP